MTEEEASGIRDRKTAQALDLMVACVDLLNGEISDEEWQERVAKLANCRSVTTIWWSPGHFERAYESGCGPRPELPPGWGHDVERLLEASHPDGGSFLDEMAEALGHKPDGELFTPDRLLVCLDTLPARVVLLLAEREDDPVWTADDRRRLRNVLPLIRKCVDVKKKLSWFEDMLELDRKMFDEIPRGFITLTPDREILFTNYLADRILADGRMLRNDGGVLRMTDARNQAALEEELSRITRLKREELPNYVWHRNLTGSIEPNSFMASMLVFGFDHWHVESARYDRVAVLVLQSQKLLSVPSVAQVRELLQLTPAQARVAVALLSDHSVEQVADELNVSVNTVRSHLRAIYAHLNVDNRAQLAQRLASLGTSTARTWAQRMDED